MKRKLITLVVIGLMLLSVAACSNQSFTQKEYSVEYGDNFTLPKPLDTTDYTVQVLNSSGEKVPLQYSSFRPAIGTYKAVYSMGNKSQEITIVCNDTLPPEIVFGEYSSYVPKDSQVAVPNYSVSDKSEIKEKQLTIKDESGNIVTHTEGEFFASAKRYTITATAEDIHGNKSQKAIVINTRTDFVDNNRAEYVLYDFDEEDYLNLIYATEGKAGATADIVRSGYPDIVNEQEGNGVLKLSTDLEYGDVYMNFVNSDQFVVKEANNIMVKFASDKDMDYLKLLNQQGEVCASVNRIKAGAWYEMKITPINYGYGYEFNGFMLMFRSDNGATVYVDEIYYEPAWSDQALPQEVVADFNDPNYESKMYQNTYNDTYNAAGSTFEVVDYPKNLSKKAMKVTTTQDRGGFTYMFDKTLNIDEIQSVTITMDCTISPTHIWLGVMQGTYRYGARIRSLAGWQTVESGQKLYIGTMHDYVLPAEPFLNSTCVDGELTGIWISVIDGNTTGNVIYIEKITVNYK